MIKPKSIIICVCIGFVLSFVVGLLAGVSFGVILLRALIFGIVFGVLGFGIGVVGRRFLSDDLDLEGGDSPAVPRQGSIVDLSIGDEPLEEDEDGPDFYVRSDVPSHGAGRGKKSDSAEAVSSGAPAPDEEAKPAADTPESSGQGQFKPISLGVPEQDSASVPQEDSDEGDVLPEIGDIPIDSFDDGEETASRGMDLAIGNGMETSQGRGGMDVTSDSHTIAQAIRTVLARDS